MSEHLLEVEDLSVTFDVLPRGAWPWTKPRKLYAVSDVSFRLEAGETLGIVGESGSGKSTLARALIRMVPAAGGKVVWLGEDLLGVGSETMRDRRRDVQMVFQDPLASLNPRMTVGEIIAEPLKTHFPDTPKDEVRAKVQDMMRKVGLLPNLLNRYPHEFSGGQCQRIGIARALILQPKLIICDEPVSALDVSIQAQVINLLRDLQEELGLSLIFIAHDLSVVKHISTRILVMYLGNLMEIAPARDLINTPRHPYTQALISAVPIPDPVIARAQEPVAVEGELPSPLSPPSGCVFRTRCPKSQASCAAEKPVVREPSPGHMVACPFHD